VEKFPDGYDDSNIVRFRNAKNELIEAVEVRTDDTNYLVKVSTKFDRIENMTKMKKTMMLLNRLFLLNRCMDDDMNEDDDDDSDDDDHRENQMLMTTTMMMKIQTNLIILMTKMTMRINFI
jgi:hypothetical protein